MNHAQIATEAIRFRISTIRRPLMDAETLDVEAMGTAAVSAGRPEVDAALRKVATAWRQAGLDSDSLARPWGPEVAEEFRNRSDIIDAIDVIAAAAGTSWNRSSDAA